MPTVSVRLVGISDALLKQLLGSCSSIIVHANDELKTPYEIIPFLDAHIECDWTVAFLHGEAAVLEYLAQLQSNEDGRVVFIQTNDITGPTLKQCFDSNVTVLLLADGTPVEVPSPSVSSASLELDIDRFRQALSIWTAWSHRRRKIENLMLRRRFEMDDESKDSISASSMTSETSKVSQFGSLFGSPISNRLITLSHIAILLFLLHFIFFKSQGN